MSCCVAFFTSPFRNCDILTIDGHGEKDTCFLGIGKNNDVKQKSAIKYPHSVGLFYGTFTDFLGLNLIQMSGRLWLCHLMQQKKCLR